MNIILHSRCLQRRVNLNMNKGTETTLVKQVCYTYDSDGKVRKCANVEKNPPTNGARFKCLCWKPDGSGTAFCKNGLRHSKNWSFVHTMLKRRTRLKVISGENKEGRKWYQLIDNFLVLLRWILSFNLKGHYFGFCINIFLISTTPKSRSWCADSERSCNICSSSL